MTTVRNPLPSRSSVSTRRRIMAFAAIGLVTVAGLQLRPGMAAESAVTIPPLAGGPAGEAATAQTVVFAGGCFWGVQGVFQHTRGVLQAVSGYAGGNKNTASYEVVSSGLTGHAESVQITYDPKVVSYPQLLQIYFSVVHDPTELNRQGPDRGSQYRSGVFYHDEAQKQAALDSKAAIDKSGQLKKPVVSEITAAGPFTAAEDYHQKFYKKNPGHYYRYRTGCGRDARLEALWGKATH